MKWYGYVVQRISLRVEIFKPGFIALFAMTRGSAVQLLSDAVVGALSLDETLRPPPRKAS